MTGTDLCVNWTLIVPVIFEPPCICNFHFSYTCYILLLIPDFMIPIISDDEVLAKNPRSHVTFRNVRVFIAGSY
jgi:hypothetical protein